MYHNSVRFLVASLYLGIFQLMIDIYVNIACIGLLCIELLVSEVWDNKMLAL